MECRVSKKTTDTDTKDLNNSEEHNLDEEVTEVIDYGEIPNNTPAKSEEK